MECGSPTRRMAVLCFYHKRKHGPPASRADLGERCGVRALIVCGWCGRWRACLGDPEETEKEICFFLLPDAVPIRGGVPYRSGTDPNHFFYFSVVQDPAQVAC